MTEEEIDNLLELLRCSDFKTILCGKELFGNLLDEEQIKVFRQYKRRKKEGWKDNPVTYFFFKDFADDNGINFYLD